MIFKIQSNIFQTNLNTILNKAKKDFDILYSENNLFLSIKNYSNKGNAKILVKKIFKPAKDYLITEIDENNLMYESQEIKEWCRDKFLALEYQELEEKEQEKLQYFYKFLIDFDNNLHLLEGRENSE